MECQDCGTEMRVKRTYPSGTDRAPTTTRVQECNCGSKFLSEESITRRLDPGVPRLPIAQATVAAVILRDEARCHYCGRSDVSLGMDHVIPLCAPIPPGVSIEQETVRRSSSENLVLCCGHCNSIKGDKVDGKRQAGKYVRT